MVVLDKVGFDAAGGQCPFVPAFTEKPAFIAKAARFNQYDARQRGLGDLHGGPLCYAICRIAKGVMLVTKVAAKGASPSPLMIYLPKVDSVNVRSDPMRFSMYIRGTVPVASIEMLIASSGPVVPSKTPVMKFS